jgi:hypothetical protein
MDVPFTGRTPAEVDQLEKSRDPTWARDDWSCREKEYCRLLSLLFAWKISKSNPRKNGLNTVWIVSGCSSLTPGGESFLTDLTTGSRIRQIVVGPATGLPTGALPEKEILFGNGNYTRTPVSRTFFRNYGVVNVIPPSLSTNLTLSSHNRPGSSQSRGRPGSRGSGWTTNSSSSASSQNNLNKSRTRVSLVTQANYKNGDAHPYPTHLTPHWFSRKTGVHVYADSLHQKKSRSSSSRPSSSSSSVRMHPKADGPSLADRRSALENVREEEEEEEEDNDADNNDDEADADENKDNGDSMEDEKKKRRFEKGSTSGFEALGFDTSLLVTTTTTIEARRRAHVLDQSKSLVSYIRNMLKQSLQNSPVTMDALDYVYRHYYLQGR